LAFDSNVWLGRQNKKPEETAEFSRLCVKNPGEEIGGSTFPQFTALRSFKSCSEGQKSTQNLRKVPETQHFLAIFYSSFCQCDDEAEQRDAFKVKTVVFAIYQHHRYVSYY
jgi:hypothetical protein